MAKRTQSNNKAVITKKVCQKKNTERQNTTRIKTAPAKTPRKLPKISKKKDKGLGICKNDMQMNFIFNNKYRIIK